MRDALRRAEGNCRPAGTSATPGTFVSIDTGSVRGPRLLHFSVLTAAWRSVGRRSDATGRPSAARAFAPAGGRGAPLEQVRKQDILDSKTAMRRRARALTYRGKETGCR